MMMMIGMGSGSARRGVGMWWYAADVVFSQSGLP